jgi:tetratricopeptide (TPR) repeat protein
VTAPPSRRAGRLAVPAALALLVAAVYGQTVSFPFVNFDDVPYILRNPALAGGLTREGIRYAFTSTLDAGWIPLTWLSRLLDVSLFGMDAGMHHAVNAVLHGLDAILLFSLLSRATGSTWRSALAAALFAVHPLHVESVAWVTERKDVLSLFFGLLATHAYVRHAEAPSRLRYGAVALLFLLGLAAKPILVTFPLLLLLLDFWPLGRLRLPADGAPEPGAAGPFPAVPWRGLVREKVPLLVLSALFSAATLAAQARIGALPSLDEIPAGARLANALLGYLFYLRKALWPSGLAILYPHPGGSADGAAAAGAALFLAAVTAAAFAAGRKRRWLVAMWLWYLVALLPVIGLVQAGGKAVGDRCAYLPLIGLYAAAAWEAGEAARRGRRWKVAVASAAAAWVVALAAAAHVQAGYWRSSEALFAHAAEVTRGNAFALGKLGNEALVAGRGEEALALFRQVIALRPADPGARYAEYAALLRLGRREEAEGALAAALRALSGSPEEVRALGRSFAAMGSFREAAACFREAARLEPGRPEDLEGLGIALLRSGDAEGAEEAFSGAVRIDPARPEGWNNLGVARARGGKERAAAAAFREALRIRPDYPGARANLDRLAGGKGEAPPPPPPPPFPGHP